MGAVCVDGSKVTRLILGWLTDTPASPSSSPACQRQSPSLFKSPCVVSGGHFRPPSQESSVQSTASSTQLQTPKPLGVPGRSIDQLMDLDPKLGGVDQRTQEISGGACRWVERASPISRTQLQTPKTLESLGKVAQSTQGLRSKALGESKNAGALWGVQGLSVYPIRGTQVTVNSPQILEGVAERLLDQLTDLDPKLGGSKNAGALWGAQGSGMHPISNTQLVATPPQNPCGWGSPRKVDQRMQESSGGAGALLEGLKLAQEAGRQISNRKVQKR